MNTLIALQANVRANTASEDTQDIEMIDNAAIDADNAATDGENTDDAKLSDINSDNAITGDGNMDNAVTGDGNTDNAVPGEVSTVHIPLLPHYGGKAKDPSQIKTSSRHTSAIAEPSTGDPLPDGHDTVKASGHTVDLTDVHTYEFLIQGAPNPHDLEGIDQHYYNRNYKTCTGAYMTLSQPEVIKYLQKWMLRQCHMQCIFQAVMRQSAELIMSHITRNTMQYTR